MVSNSTISWSYDILYSWYRKRLTYQQHETGKDPVLAIIYESKRPKKKDLTVLEPFVRPNITFAGVYPVQNPEKYPNGMYILMEAVPGKRKYMFAVFPTRTDCPVPIIVANHFTFVVDEHDIKNPCHFHSTHYTCQKNGEVYVWLDPHYKDHFPLNLELPKYGSTDTIIHHVVNQQHKDAILDIMRHPWKSSRLSGGSKRRREPNAHAYAARPIQSNSFARLWLERDYRGLYAFGIPQEGGFQWSVRLLRKGRDRVQQAYLFVTESDDEAIFQHVLADLILRYEPY